MKNMKNKTFKKLKSSVWAMIKQFRVIINLTHKGSESQIFKFYEMRLIVE
jgi:hypothetical protein